MLFVDAKIPATIAANYGSTARSQVDLGTKTIAASTNEKAYITLKYYYIDTHNLVQTLKHQG